MADWRDAIQEAPSGVRLLVEVSAGARDEAFPDGYNPWRNRIGVRVRAPAQEGRANDAVVGLVAAALGVPRAAVTLEAGHLGSLKSLRVAGASREAVAQRLAALDTAP